jgi:hypothetical protein
MTVQHPRLFSASVERVFDTAVDVCRADRDAVILGRRTPDECNARHTFWIILRQNYGLSFPEIARVSNCDHTSVIHGTSVIRYDQVEPFVTEVRRRLEIQGEAKDINALLRKIRRALIASPDIYDQLENLITESNERNALRSVTP